MNLQLNYMGKFQQFFALSSSQNSFLRWTLDLDHPYSLYGNTQSAAKSTDGVVGPDFCARRESRAPGFLLRGT